MINKYPLLLFMALAVTGWAQDTITVQTLTYDSTGRDYYFDFPADDGTTYAKILMEYSMRCTDGLVSTPADRNRGCGEWDYSCNTYIIDEDRQDSLQAQHPSHLLGGWLQGQELHYTSEKVYDYYQRSLLMGIVSDDSEAVAFGRTAENTIVDTVSGPTAFYRQIFTAEDLINSGATAGEIYGVTLPMSGLGMTTTAVSIEATSIGDLSDLPTTRPAPASVRSTVDYGDSTQTLWFCQPFLWDGQGNIIVDITISGNEAGPLATATYDASRPMTMAAISSNQYLELDGASHYLLQDDQLGQISNQVTVEFWSNGNPAALPANNSIIEGSNAQGGREINIHLPWSNGQVYWDCGNVNGYDRINKTVSPEIFEDSWHHWAFTKDATSGNMSIYIDGELFHHEGGKTKPIDLERLFIGCSRQANNHYPGHLDELRIWSRALSAQEIINQMRRSSHDSVLASADGLLYAFEMDGTGPDLKDSKSGATATSFGTTRRRSYPADAIFSGFTLRQHTSSIGFIQGNIESTCSESVVIDSVEQRPVAIREYVVEGTDLVLDTTYDVYPAGITTTYGQDGSIVNTATIEAEGTIEVSTLDYYVKQPMRFEIMSFVTPYGIFLDLGEEGRTWTFDMTDYSPILKGQKRMFLGNGGQFQEEMDIKFHFIKGVPPRDVLDIQQIWRPGDLCSFESIDSDNCFEPRTTRLNEDGKHFKIRSMVTGHGQEGEFISRLHFLSVNGAIEFDWDGWKECGENPVYPQGGTWIYDRAGWCPGMATDLYEWELKDLVSAGEEVELDYGMLSATGDSRYLVNHQLVTYGDFNYDFDVSIESVQVPGDRVEYARYNPTCDQPTITIRNQGAETISSIDLEYTMGGETVDYTWSGTLEPLESETIDLPKPALSTLAGIPPGKADFVVSITRINDGSVTDQQAYNDTYYSTFEMPAMYNAEEYVLLTRSNNRGSQNSLTITDYDGNIVLDRPTFANNTSYRDTFQLEPGCYTIDLQDRGDNGLEFWAQANQGSGTMLLRGDGNSLFRFEPDFGAFIKYSFVVAEVTNVVEHPVAQQLETYPNPARSEVTVVLPEENLQGSSITIRNMYGSIVASRSVDAGAPTVIVPLGNLQPAIYSIELMKGKQRIGVSRFVKL